MKILYPFLDFRAACFAKLLPEIYRELTPNKLPGIKFSRAPTDFKNLHGQ